MNILNYECEAKIQNIELIDSILEITLKHYEIEWYRQFCFAAHELLTNSIEAMSKHSNVDNKIFIKLIMGTDLVSFRVSDTGGGVQADINDLIKKNETLNMEGRGRGLYMIKALVDNFYFFKADDDHYTYVISKNIVNPNESEA